MTMIFDIRGFIAATFAAVFLAVGVSSASADCLVGCTPSQPSGSLGLDGQAAVAGNGLGLFGGTDGSAFADKLGAAELNITLGGTGGLCTTPDCTTANGGITGSYMEVVTAGAHGLSDTVGTPASAATQLASNGLLAAQFPNGFGVQLGSTTQAAGMAAAAFSGDGGNAAANLYGVTTNAGTLEVGGVCPTCQSGGFSLSTGAHQFGDATASGFSYTPGVPAEVINSIGLNAANQLFVGAGS